MTRPMAKLIQLNGGDLSGHLTNLCGFLAFFLSFFLDRIDLGRPCSEDIVLFRRCFVVSRDWKFVKI